MTEDWKKKISKALKGNKNSSKTRTLEWKEKIRKSLIGHKVSEESRLKMSKMKIGNKNMLGKKHTEETKKKISDSKKGLVPWNYIKDRSLIKHQEKRNNNRYKEWSLKVKKRDKWKCRINNKDCEGKVIAHHILLWSSFPEVRYSLNNGITLCHFHHPRRREDEKRQIPIFNKLVTS